jgi:solute carrier family 31 (copper transporter), member 1
MDHGNHGDGGHHMPGPKCSMHMLWNTQVIDTCIIFPQWHISSNASFVISFFIIVALGILYEYMRQIQKTLDRRIALSLENTRAKAKSRSVGTSSGRSSPGEDMAEETGLLNGRRVFKAVDHK